MADAHRETAQAASAAGLVPPHLLAAAPEGYTDGHTLWIREDVLQARPHLQWERAAPVILPAADGAAAPAAATPPAAAAAAAAVTAASTAAPTAVSPTEGEAGTVATNGGDASGLLSPQSSAQSSMQSSAQSSAAVPAAASVDVGRVEDRHVVANGCGAGGHDVDSGGGANECEANGCGANGCDANGRGAEGYVDGVASESSAA